MKIKLLLSALALCIVTSAAVAQGDDVPVAVKATFEKQYPNAEKVTFKDNLFNTWVDFYENGEKMKASYNKKGVWQGTEKDWTFEQLPDAVKDGFKKSKYADREVEEVKVVYRPGGTLRYRIKTRKNDIQKKNLYFKEDGQLVEDNITL